MFKRYRRRRPYRRRGLQKRVSRIGFPGKLMRTFSYFVGQHNVYWDYGWNRYEDTFKSWQPFKFKIQVTDFIKNLMNEYTMFMITRITFVLDQFSAGNMIAYEDNPTPANVSSYPTKLMFENYLVDNFNLRFGVIDPDYVTTSVNLAYDQSENVKSYPIKPRRNNKIIKRWYPCALTPYKLEEASLQNTIETLLTLMKARNNKTTFIIGYSPFSGGIKKENQKQFESVSVQFRYRMYVNFQCSGRKPNYGMSNKTVSIVGRSLRVGTEIKNDLN